MSYLGWAGITAGILAGWLVLGLVVALMFHTWKRAVIMADRHVDWREAGALGVLDDWAVPPRTPPKGISSGSDWRLAA